MHVSLLGGESGGGGSPRLWVTDRDTFAVQGWKTDDGDQVEIPHRLLTFAEKGTCLTGLRDSGRGTFYLTGKLVTDPTALEIMQIPSHEIAVEVPIGRERMPDAALPG